ncbi:aldehyde dehydrogenase family protein [Micromonospora sp. M12]
MIESVAGLADDFAWIEEVGNSLIVREPIGVVGAITPWNFPLQQIVSSWRRRSSPATRWSSSRPRTPR